MMITREIFVFLTAACLTVNLIDLCNGHPDQERQTSDELSTIDRNSTEETSKIFKIVRDELARENHGVEESTEDDDGKEIIEKTKNETDAPMKPLSRSTRSCIGGRISEKCSSPKNIGKSSSGCKCGEFNARPLKDTMSALKATMTAGMSALKTAVKHLRTVPCKFCKKHNQTTDANDCCIHCNPPSPKPVAPTCIERCYQSISQVCQAKCIDQCGPSGLFRNPEACRMKCFKDCLQVSAVDCQSKCNPPPVPKPIPPTCIETCYQSIPQACQAKCIAQYGPSGLFQNPEAYKMKCYQDCVRESTALCQLNCNPPPEPKPIPPTCIETCYQSIPQACQAKCIAQYGPSGLFQNPEAYKMKCYQDCVRESTALCQLNCNPPPEPKPIPPTCIETCYQSIPQACQAKCIAQCGPSGLFQNPEAYQMKCFQDCVRESTVLCQLKCNPPPEPEPIPPTCIETCQQSILKKCQAKCIAQCGPSGLFQNPEAYQMKCFQDCVRESTVLCQLKCNPPPEPEPIPPTCIETCQQLILKKCQAKCIDQCGPFDLFQNPEAYQMKCFQDCVRESTALCQLNCNPPPEPKPIPPTCIETCQQSILTKCQAKCIAQCGPSGLFQNPEAYQMKCFQDCVRESTALCQLNCNPPPEPKPIPPTCIETCYQSIPQACQAKCIAQYGPSGLFQNPEAYKMKCYQDCVRESTALCQLNCNPPPEPEPIPPTCIETCQQSILKKCQAKCIDQCGPFDLFQNPEAYQMKCFQDCVRESAVLCQSRCDPSIPSRPKSSGCLLKSNIFDKSRSSIFDIILPSSSQKFQSNNRNDRQSIFSKKPSTLIDKWQTGKSPSSWGKGSNLKSFKNKGALTTTTKNEFDIVRDHTIEFFTNFFGHIKLLLQSLKSIYEKFTIDITSNGKFDKCGSRIDTSSSIFNAVTSELQALIEYGPSFVDRVVDDDSSNRRRVTVPDIPIIGDPSDQLANTLKNLRTMMTGVVDVTNRWMTLYGMDPRTIDIYTDKSASNRGTGDDIIRNMLNAIGLQSRDSNNGNYNCGDSTRKFDNFDRILEFAGQLPGWVIERLIELGSAVGSMTGDGSMSFDPMEIARRGAPLAGFMGATPPLFGGTIKKSIGTTDRCNLYRAIVCPYVNHANGIDRPLVESVLGFRLNNGDVVGVLLPDGTQKIITVANDKCNCETRGYQKQVYEIDLTGLRDCTCTDNCSYIR